MFENHKIRTHFKELVELVGIENDFFRGKENRNYHNRTRFRKQYMRIRTDLILNFKSWDKEYNGAHGPVKDKDKNNLLEKINNLRQIVEDFQDILKRKGMEVLCHDNINEMLYRLEQLEKILNGGPVRPKKNIKYEGGHYIKLIETSIELFEAKGRLAKILKNRDLDFYVDKEKKIFRAQLLVKPGIETNDSDFTRVSGSLQTRIRNSIIAIKFSMDKFKSDFHQYRNSKLYGHKDNTNHNNLIFVIHDTEPQMIEIEDNILKQKLRIEVKTIIIHIYHRVLKNEHDASYAENKAAKPNSPHLYSHVCECTKWKVDDDILEHNHNILREKSLLKDYEPYP